MAKILRILNKDYKLVNQADPSQHIIVHRVSQEMGENRLKPKNATDTWKKMYNVVDNCGITKWPNGTKIQLQNKPGAAGAVAEWPWIIDSDNAKWIMEEIPEVAEVKVSTGTGKRGRPPGSKNKAKVAAPVAQVNAPVADTTPADTTPAAADAIPADTKIEEPIATATDEATAATDAVQPVAEVEVPKTETAIMNGDGTPAVEDASAAQA